MEIVGSDDEMSYDKESDAAVFGFSERILSGDEVGGC